MEDFKWYAILVIGVAVAMCTCQIGMTWAKAWETRWATEAGYEEIMEDGQVLWRLRDADSR